MRSGSNLARQLQTGSLVDLSVAKLIALLNLVGINLDAGPRQGHDHALQSLSQSASVSYKTVLEPVQLAAALVDGELPEGITPHIATLLDEDPLCMGTFIFLGLQHGAGHWPERKMQSIVNASHKRYNSNMKTATIPPVRIDPSFRKDIEQSLEGGESLASLVETAVRKEVTRRRVQSEFIRRGMAAINRTVAAGDGVPAEVVIAKLEAKLAAARSAKKAA